LVEEGGVDHVLFVYKILKEIGSYSIKRISAWVIKILDIRNIESSSNELLLKSNRAPEAHCLWISAYVSWRKLLLLGKERSIPQDCKFVRHISAVKQGTSINSMLFCLTEVSLTQVHY
jgi:hypothetical protein